MDLLLEESARGVTVFFSSHILSEVQRLCRRVAIIKEGRVIASEDVAALRQKRLRKVSFTSARPPGHADFPSGSARELVREAEAGGQFRIRFLYAGDSNSLVRELARFDIHQLRIEEPSLEEVFMHYYAATEDAP
jgi:ABC-2 type transport system ATP-binding protein